MKSKIQQLIELAAWDSIKCECGSSEIEGYWICKGCGKQLYEAFSTNEIIHAKI